MSPAVALSATPSLAVDDLLGGQRVLAAIPRSALDWVAVIRRGIPTGAVDALTRLTHLSQAELANAVGIPERTLARRTRAGSTARSRPGCCVWHAWWRAVRRSSLAWTRPSIGSSRSMPRSAELPR